ncbi:thiol reductant ABC exporter subunit CydC [Actinokineospora sp. G85]|uniref:thiol reductant ABC exporter subunit CydC n=1 Tax=Actinokineospora sp. G85 TaxID=3406626 RepID=UPI003C721B63
MAVVVQGWALASAVAGLVGGTGVPRWALPVLVGAVVARSLLGWATQVVAVRAAAGAKAELRALLLDRSLALGPEWIAERGPAELTALATRGLDALDDYFAVYLPALVTAVAAPLSVGAAILVVDWQSALVVALTLPLIPLFAIVIGRYTEDEVGHAATAVERLSGQVLELVRVLPVLSAFRRAHAQAEAVRAVSDDHRRRALGVLRVAFLSAFALELVATLSVALVAVVIGLRLVSGDLTLVVGLFVLVVVPECYLPLRAAGAAHHASADGLEAVRRVAAVPVPGGGGVDGVEAVPGGRVVSGFSELRVDGLRVRRRDGFAPDGVSLVVRPGEVVRLDSPSGSGKSTLFSVLLGFVSPSDGSVEVDGVALAELDIAAWRRLVGWVAQRPVLADEVVDVPAQWAREVGVEHLLGRRVVELSTGERQRVAVARALARPGVRLLVLDEPTAHLDTASAAVVMAAIQRAADRGAAVLMATHRAVEGAGVVTEHEPVRAEPVPRGPRVRVRSLVTGRLVSGALLGAAALVCGVALTALSGWLIAKASQQPPILTLSIAVVGVRFFGLARATLRYLERLRTHDAAFALATTLRVGLWRTLVHLGPARALRHRETLHHLVDDVDSVRDLTPRVLTPPIVAAAVSLTAVAVVTAILPTAGLVLATAALIAGLAGPALAYAADHHATRTAATTRTTLRTTTLTLLDAAPDLLARGEATKHRADIATHDHLLTHSTRRSAFGAGAGTALITLTTGLTAAAMITVSAGAPIDPVLYPILALIPLALPEALTPLTTAAINLAPLRAALPDQPPTDLSTAQPVVHSQDPQPPMLTPAPVDWPRGRPPVERRGMAVAAFDGVCVGWPGGVDVLCGVDLDVLPGERVVVVGESGAGKSTLAALVLGFLEPRVGSVRRSGAVAWCPQEPMLAATSIRENLRLAKPGAADGELRAVLDRLGVHLPLDVTATTLSGGEAHRVALARSLLADADLLVVDEPTAHLDAVSAAAVRGAIAGYPGAVLHITHHAEDVEGADRVVEVARGGVVERPLVG